MNNPLVVLIWRIYECGVESPSEIRTIYLSWCETFYVLGDGVNKTELLITWGELVQTALMHSELLIWFTLRLYMDDEHHLVAPVGDKVLETQVDQG